MKAGKEIKRIYIRHYRDNDSLRAYVEWADGSRTEGDAEIYHGVRVTSGTHMGALFERGIREGLRVDYQTW